MVAHSMITFALLSANVLLCAFASRLWDLHGAGPVGEGRRILVVHASIGGGHKAAAKAVIEQLNKALPEAETVMVDIVEASNVTFQDGSRDGFVPPRHLRTLTKDAFMWTRAHAPLISNAVIEGADKQSDMSKWYGTKGASWLLKWAQHNPVLGALSLYNAMGNFESFVLRHRWDLIIHTHFWAPMVLARLRRSSKLYLPQVTIITDFHAHGTWVEDWDTDRFFVASAEVKETLVSKYRIPASKITDSGIPISPKVAEQTPEASWEKLQEIGIEPPKKQFYNVSTESEDSSERSQVGRLILAFPTSEDDKACLDVWERVADFIRAHPEHKAVMVSGRKETELRIPFANSVSAREGSHSLPPGAITVLGFTTMLPQLLTVADLIISKPGGLTTAESLAAGTGWLIMRPWLLDVEKPNYKFLKENGVAVGAESVRDVIPKLEHVLTPQAQETSLLVDKMKMHAKHLAHPRSAEAVSKYVGELFTRTKAQQQPPGICCCERGSKKCAYLLSRDAVSQPHLQPCHFYFTHSHTAMCPAQCGKLKMLERAPAARWYSESGCNDHHDDIMGMHRLAVDY